ncbi:MAG: hypothetical protein MK193_02975 [Lentisphaeria bacterium]|nr:hypothetical protein [Lentisphaeria bacterium]
MTRGEDLLYFGENVEEENIPKVKKSLTRKQLSATTAKGIKVITPSPQVKNDS